MRTLARCPVCGELATVRVGGDAAPAFARHTRRMFSGDKMVCEGSARETTAAAVLSWADDAARDAQQVLDGVHTRAVEAEERLRRAIAEVRRDHALAVKSIGAEVKAAKADLRDLAKLRAQLGHGAAAVEPPKGETR